MNGEIKQIQTEERHAKQVAEYRKEMPQETFTFKCLKYII